MMSCINTIRSPGSGKSDEPRMDVGFNPDSENGSGGYGGEPPVEPGATGFTGDLRRHGRCASHGGWRHSRRCDAPSEVNRVAFRGQRRLVDRLAHRRVGVDGGVDFLGGEFLVERQAHLGDQFGGVVADDVRA